MQSSSSFECKTAWEMTWSSVTFGCQALDNLLEGGIPSRGITEIYGESASGKSQICMQLAVAAQLPLDRGGTGRGVVYFTTTGGVFPSQRLFQIIETFKERHRDLQIDYMSNIFIQSQLDLPSFLSCLREKLPAFLQSHKIGLVIVDSLGIFRTETNAVARSKNLRVDFGQQLKKLADLHDFAIVCVNEVVSVPNHETTIPSLGVSWSNIVTTRLRVARSHKTTRDGNVVRIMSIDHSGTLPRIIGDAAEFVVTGKGICDIY
ncbi:DNA repair protein XRCC3 [Phlebotomus papatasi]|uniref:DNA repair protein XRCC3 n=1 Tax=Phlebotomus papatasi TaxID=29031 RepID=UPI002483D296|nr:DNA repair protein XRCC3 [Phlebotomus papatasi]XP_055699684.1 DNA repair protein XRCC3 [Phlebotomus papatasi]